MSQAATPAPMVDGSTWNIAAEHTAEFRPGFLVWLALNGHVWRRFEAEASRVWNRGRRHYSARTIIEVLRHESALSDTGVVYKLNDHNTPDLARLYRLVHPERAELFEIRRGGRATA